MESTLGKDNTNQFEREYFTKYPKQNNVDSIRDHKYTLSESSNSWICTCGFPNIVFSSVCGRCGISKEWFFQTVNVDILIQRLKEHQESERIRLENIRFQEDERKRIVQENAENDRIRLEEDAIK